MAKKAVSYRGTSEGSETSADEYIFDEANPTLPGLFLLGPYVFSLVLKNKRSKKDHTKIVWIDLDSPHRELLNGGLGMS